MGDSNTEAANLKTDMIRLFLSYLDRPAFMLLGLVYQLFFNVASVNIFSSDTIMKFYGRVQLILGVFMMFQLAMTILKGIVNPDSFTDSKSGANNLIMRIVTALFFLAIIVPINTGNGNEYAKQINNNGLLFGTLYSLQHRILANNTLGRIILGTSDTSSNYISFSDDDNEENLKTSSRIFTSAVLKGFYRINLLPEEDRPKHDDSKDDAVFNDNRVCQDIDDELLEAYTRVDADPNEIISMVNLTCDSDGSELGPFQQIVNLVSPRLAGNSRYILVYNGFLSTIVAFIFVFILLSFTVDVAVRNVKLAILRVLAPIPIISYMDPNGSKDNAFNSWVKTLTSTYIDLFIRLAVVYFVIFMIQDMIVNGIVIKHAGGILGVFSWIIIWIGLFVFAKQAPKFIKQVLGMKDDGGSLFGGLGAALGLGAAGFGAVGSAITGYRASLMADKTRESFGENVNARSPANTAKHLLAGLAGGVMGAGTGAAAAINAKDHALKNSLDAMRKRNAEIMAKGNDGSTFFGRARSGLQQYWTGDGASAAGERNIATMKSQQAALDQIGKQVSGEMPKYTWTFGSGGEGYTDSTGASLDKKKFNFKTFSAKMAEAQAAGRDSITVFDSEGGEHTISYSTAELMQGKIRTENENDYLQKVLGVNGKAAPDGFTDAKLVEYVRDAQMKGAGTVASRSDYKKGSERLEVQITQANRENVIKKANDRYSGKK